MFLSFSRLAWSCPDVASLCQRMLYLRVLTHSHSCNAIAMRHDATARTSPSLTMQQGGNLHCSEEHLDTGLKDIVLSPEMGRDLAHCRWKKQCAQRIGSQTSW